MSESGRPRYCATFTLVASVLMFSCYRAYPPSRPAGVPNAAVWAGGLDGGGWVTCSNEASTEYNICSLYDEEGRTRGPAKYKLKNEDRAARPSELRFTYVTGRAIGLEGSRELVKVLQLGDQHPQGSVP